MTLSTIYLRNLLSRAQEGKASMAELLNAKRMIAENYGDCDGDLELKDIVDALGGFWEKAYNVGENVAGNVADVAGGFFEKLGDSIGDIIDFF